MSHDKKWIQLNVGGTVFITSRSTLTKSTPPNSPLHRISSSSTNVTFDRDESGAFLIDRDPVFFQPVLNFLRHGRLILNKDIPEEGILLEAEYFNLPELIKVVKLRMQSRRGYSIQSCQHRSATPGAPAAINQQQQHHHHHHGHHHGHNHHHQLAQVSNISPAPALAGSSNYPTLNSLINQQEYMNNYLNGLLADDINVGI